MMLLQFAVRMSLGSVLLVSIASRLEADTIYIEGANATLATLNPTTGAVQVIGSTSGVGLGGLGFGSNGTLYGLSLAMNLYTIDTSTGAATLLGPTGLTYDGGGYALGATSDGTLYLQNTGELYVVDPTTHHASLLGPLGFNTSADCNGDGSNHLYIINDASAGLYDLNTTNGQTTLIGDGAVGNIYGMAFANGTMYAMESTGTGVFSVSLTDGHDRLVSNYDPSQIGGFIESAATRFSATSVPEPTALVLAFAGMLSLCSVSAVRLLKGHVAR